MASTVPEQLDLSSLRSFSSDWTPSLRLAVCIATSYAGQRLSQRARALTSYQVLSDLPTDALKAPGGHANEDEKPVWPQQQEQTAPSEHTASSGQNQRDYVLGWEDFVQKFVSATCQHLGVNEEALPPGPLLLRDVLLAGQRQLESNTQCDRYAQILQEAEDLLTREESEGFETGSLFWRRHSDVVIRSDAASDFQYDNKKAAKRRKLEQEISYMKQAASKSGADGHQATEENFDKLSMESDAREVCSDVTLTIQCLAESWADNSNPQVPQASCAATQSGGASTGSNDDLGQAFEIFNELLLVALGLGQYRSLDSGTTLFEQDALFDESPRQTATMASRHAQGSAATTAHAEGASAPDSINKPTFEEALNTVNAKASSSWRWTSVKSMFGIEQLGKTMGLSQSASTATGTKKAADDDPTRAKKPAKPGEICHYDARARAMIHVAGAALGLSDRIAQDSEKVLAQTIHFIMNEACSAARRQGQEDPLASLPLGAAVDFKKDAIVSRVYNAEETTVSEQRTSWMNQAGNNAVEEQKKLGWKKWMVTGSGFALGGAVLGVTGGLAAPLVVPALAGLTGITFLATSGGIIMLGTLFGLTGGGLAGYRVHRRLRGLASFEFQELHTPARLAGISIPSLHATICVSGIILAEEDQREIWQSVWSAASDSRDAYVVSSEAKFFAEAGKSLRSYVFTYLTKQIGSKAAQEVLENTALASLAAIMLPFTVASALGTGLDSIFVRAKTKAVKQGLILAETLKAEVQGHRPVTLIGASLGAVTVLTCLQALAEDPEFNSHLIDSVYLICTPDTTGISSMRRARSLVARRFVNVFSRTDMVCGIAAWLGLKLSVKDITAGKAPRVLGSGPLVGVPGLENVDASGVIASHFDLSDGSKLAEICCLAGVLCS